MIIYSYSVPFHSFHFTSMKKDTANWSGTDKEISPYEKNYIMGLWKFSDKISLEELIEVAKEAAKNPKYLQIYIRRCSRDQYGIGFAYDNSDKIPGPGQNKEYMDPVMDSLKRQFGNDLVGWDISSPVWIIK